MITPTVGRKVWYRPGMSDLVGPIPMAVLSGQPLDATIIAVWGDRVINALVTDINGHQFGRRSIRLAQEGDDQAPVNAAGFPDHGYAEWMPYQNGQAKASSAS